MKKIKAIWELLRLEHGVMIAIAILIGSLIALKGEGFPVFDKFILTFFTALFLEASTFALNDYYDLEIDKKNKRVDRPLVRGDLSPKSALYIFFILFPLGIICSFFVNTACFIIALITALLAILYDAKMKKIKLLGNFYIAYVMAIPFIFGGAAVLENNVLFFEIDSAIYIIALIAFFAGSGREIMKDVMDFEGDVKKGVKSFPKYIGERKSNIIAGFFFIIAICLSFLPFIIKDQIYYLNYSYLLLVFITDIMLLSTSFQLIIKKKPNLKIYRSFTLFAIFIGLIAFLIPIILLIIFGG
ncbi:MAG: UbiA family prenyltransferase [Thermoplasmatales archaeon]|nr:MAG: UbiA family prenyltransferase [Thermoplasmatales archaeon]